MNQIHVHRIVTDFFTPVELDFERDLIPRVYPIGGANGSGKSTLLQLVFLLLTAPSQPLRHRYLHNLLSDRSPEDIDAGEPIAQIDLSLGNCQFRLVFSIDPLWAIDETAVRVLRLGHFARYQNISVDRSFGLPGEFSHRLPCYPIYIGDNHLLFCQIYHNDRLLDKVSEYATVFEAIASQVYLAAHASDILRFLDCDLIQGLHGTSAYAVVVRDLPNIFPNFLNLDRELGWWLPDNEAEGFCSINLERLSIMLDPASAPQGGRAKPGLVLIDDIDRGLHPDNQSQVVRDLERISQMHQYILATHSYELCTALTPAHVKEILLR